VCGGGEGRGEVWPVEFAWIRESVKSGLPDHPNNTHTKKEWAIMVIALFTSDFPTIQLCEHHILEHKPTPESSTDRSCAPVL